MTKRFKEAMEEIDRTTMHFCARCETWQKRFEIHFCNATEEWKAAKAAWWAEYNASKAQVDTPPEPEPVHSNVHFSEPVHSEPVHSTVEEEHQEVDISEVDTVDTVDKVDMEEAVHSPKVDARREYEREYKRKKRAEAKAVAEPAA
jgi:hypothetical protein